MLDVWHLHNGINVVVYFKSGKYVRMMCVIQSVTRTYSERINARTNYEFSQQQELSQYV